MDWRILVFYLEPEARICIVIYYTNPCQKRGIKFTNIRQSMLKLKTQFGFHDLFRF